MEEDQIINIMFRLYDNYIKCTLHSLKSVFDRV